MGIYNAAFGQLYIHGGICCRIDIFIKDQIRHIDLKILILGIFIFVQDQIRVGHIMISGHFSLIFPVGFCMNGLK